MFYHASLHRRLLLGFSVVALLTVLLGIFASWQFTRVATATDESIRSTVADIETRDQLDAIAARRGDLLHRLQAGATAAAIRELTLGPEWTGLVLQADIEPDLRTAIRQMAASREAFFSKQEELARRLGESRGYEQALRDQLLPLEQKLAADEAEQVRRVNTEVEKIRNDTVSSLFLNFDATMDQVSLMLDTQARLFRLQVAEVGTAPVKPLREEIIQSLESQQDDAARRLASKLREPASYSHEALFKELAEFTSNVVFRGRTAVVTAAVENISAMGEQIDLSQSATRQLEEQRARLSDGLQKSSAQTAEILQMASQIYGNPAGNSQQNLVPSREDRLARMKLAAQELNAGAHGLTGAALDKAILQLQHSLLDEIDGVTASTVQLTHARGALSKAEDTLRAALAQDSIRARSVAREMVARGRTHADSISLISGQARGWILAITITATLVALALAVVFARGVSGSLRRVAGLISQTVEELSSASALVSVNSGALSDGANGQAASIEQTSASLEELSSMTMSNTEHASTAQQLASRAHQAADTGAAGVLQLADAMTELQQSSTNVAKIVKTIDEIAFQTNILALNAAVEAARAGEAGAGFAVVAEEVRSLAKRSAEAARETATTVEMALHKSECGVTLSSQVAVGFTEIQEKTREVDKLVTEISGASNEQNLGIKQIRDAVTQINSITQTNAIQAQESASAASVLRDQAVALENCVQEMNLLINGRIGKSPTSMGETLSSPAEIISSPRMPLGNKRPVTPARTSS